jgi:WD40 repeat protein
MDADLCRLNAAVQAIKDDSAKKSNALEAGYLFYRHCDNQIDRIRSFMRDIRSFLADTPSHVPQTQPNRPTANPPGSVRLLIEFRATSAVLSVGFSSDGSFFVCVSQKEVIIVDSATTTVRFSLQIPDTTDCDSCAGRSLSIARDSRHLVINGHSGALHFFPITDGAHGSTLKWHTAAVCAIAFAPDSHTFFSGGRDGVLAEWTVSAEQPTRSFRPCPHEVISAIAIDDDFSFIAVGFESGMVGLYEPTFTQPMNRFLAHSSPLTAVICSQFDETIVTASCDGTAKVWVLKGVATCKRVLGEHDGAVMTACFAPKARLAFTGSDDKSIRCWDYVSGNRVFTLNAHARPAFAITHHPKQAVFASCAGDNLVCLWEYGAG